MPSTYYQLLEVDRLASTDVIEAAYRRLALRYHPDRNPGGDTLRKMQQINEAYAVLRDPIKRQQYDRTIAEAPPPNSGPATSRGDTSSRSYGQTSTQQPSTPIFCQSCGCTSTSLRMAAFPYVVSLLIVTFHTSWDGVYCRKCRHSETIRAKLVTLLFGWWGIPHGPLRTLRVLFGSNDGFIPARPNAEFLKYLGLFFLSRGDLRRARTTILASLDYVYDKELDFLNRTTLSAVVPDDSDDEFDSEAIHRLSGKLVTWIAVVLILGPLGLWGINSCSAPNTVREATLQSAAYAPLPTSTPSPTRQPTSTPQATATDRLTRLHLAPGARQPTNTPLPTVTPAATATKEPEPTPSPLPVAVTGQIRSGVQRLYENPNRRDNMPGSILRSGQEFDVMGQYDDCTWIQVVTKAGKTGWLPVDDELIMLSAECQSLPSAYYPPKSGIMFAKSGKNDYGELQIINAGISDTLVYVIDAENLTIAVAYVRTQDTFTIEGIPDGLYVVYMRSGNLWDGTSFMLGDIMKRFEEPFDFTTERRNGRYYTSVWEITLEPVADGNAAVEPVDEEDFPEIPTEAP